MRFANLSLSVIALSVSSLSHAIVISGDHTLSNGNSVDLQGLEWLSLDHTAGMSRTSLESSGGTFTDRYGDTQSFGTPDGWRYATRTETETMINSLWGGTHDGWAANNGAGAGWFIDNFGGLAFDAWSGNTRTDNMRTDGAWTNLDYSDFFFGEAGECSSNTTQGCRGHVLHGDNYYRNINGYNVDTRASETSYLANTGEVGWLADYWGGDFGITPNNGTIYSSFTHNNFGSMLVRDIQDVPEPSTMALFGLSLAGFGLARRRKSAA